jgi:predicted MFS family arabinose efflux permease
VSAPGAAAHRRAEWALLFGNFAIGSGVMVVPGAMNDIVHSLGVSVALGGQLVTVAAVTMALGAPLLAFAVGTRDRRALLTFALIWCALGHALSGSGQFTLFSYMAPIYRNDLGASANAITGLFFWFGIFGLVGNVLVSRSIDRIGAAPLIAVLLALMLASFVLWPLAHSVVTMAAVLVPWALACFSSNSAQQARLGAAAPSLAPVLMALNTSAIYLGQALGAAGGGAIVAANQVAGRAAFASMALVASAWMTAALATSIWAARRMKPQRP